MTRDDRLRDAEARTRTHIEKQQKRLAAIQAQQRADARNALARRRAQVGKLAEKAGLLVWDNATLDHLFTLLATLRNVANPVAVLDSLVWNVEELAEHGPDTASVAAAPWQSPSHGT